MKTKIVSLVSILGLISGSLVSPLMASAATSSMSPLTVTSSSHIVVMEFEPWYGPDGITFSGSKVGKPLKTSPDMAKLGGGYDSSDTAIIDKQMKQIQDLGVDAILIDLSNYDGCVFDYNFCPASTVAEKQEIYNVAAASLKGNITAIYKEMDALSKNGGTKLKIIPLIGGQATTDFTKSTITGKDGVQMATDFFLGLQKSYPELTVNYEGKPLMVYFHGAAQPTASDPSAWWSKTNNSLLGVSGVTGKTYANSITYRHMGGFFDDQPQIRVSTNAVSALKKGGSYPANGFWTWIDRYNTNAGLYPSYNTSSTGGVEAFTATYAAPGKTSAGWGTPGHYAFDDTLANGGNSFKSYMTQASALRPTFLLINQWNEFVPGDQGFDINTTNNIEPSTLYGTYRTDVVTSSISAYRSSLTAPVNPPSAPSSYSTVGYLDVVSSTGVASGWTFDPDNSGSSINVQFYINGPRGTGTLAGTISANASRPDVNQVTGVSGNHGYNFSIPAAYKDGHSHTIYAYGVDSGGNVSNSSMLANSPKTFTIGSSGGSTPPPPPPPPKNLPPPSDDCKGGVCL